MNEDWSIITAKLCPEQYMTANTAHDLQDILLTQWEKGRDTLAKALKDKEPAPKMPANTQVKEEIKLKIELDPHGNPVHPDKIPPFISIHLARFNQYKNKHFVAVTPPPTLMLPITDHPNCFLKGSLVSVTAHLGPSMYGGHYVAYLKKSEAWGYCSDSTLGICESEEEVKKDISTQGYLFFYRCEGIVRN